LLTVFNQSPGPVSGPNLGPGHFQKEHTMKKRFIVGSGLAGLALSATSALAELPTEAATAISGVSTFATDIVSAVWPIVGTLVLAAIGIKLFKRFSGKI
jgi:hypothetical protein